MLVLSRKATQSLCIGEQIEITVLDVRGGRVRLGIACPGAIPIRRSELPQFDRHAARPGEADIAGEQDLNESLERSCFQAMA